MDSSKLPDSTALTGLTLTKLPMDAPARKTARRAHQRTVRCLAVALPVAALACASTVPIPGDRDAGFQLDSASAPYDTLFGGRRVYLEGEVDVPAKAIPGRFGARYPTELKGQEIVGAVSMQFVIDTAGRVEAPSITVISSAHPAFTQSVAEFLATARYQPARRGRSPVRMWVRQRFEFKLDCWLARPIPGVLPCRRARPVPPP